MVTMSPAPGQTLGRQFWGPQIPAPLSQAPAPLTPLQVSNLSCSQVLSLWQRQPSKPQSQVWGMLLGHPNRRDLGAEAEKKKQKRETGRWPAS